MRDCISSIALKRALLCCLPLAALAQPSQNDRLLNRPLRVVAASGPGSGVDIVARVTGAKLSELLGQPVVIENRAGAGGVVGMKIVADADPDGQTIGVVPAAFALNPSFYSKLPFDTFRDFAPITLLASQGNILILHPTMPVRSTRELIALAKSKPGLFNFASAGFGSSGHLSMVLFNFTAGLDMTHLPYKGGGAASIAVLAGEAQMAMVGIVSVIQHVKAGKLRALGVTSRTPVPELPEVPTISESGLAGYEVYSWNGVVAPARTPAALIAHLYATIATALKTPDLRSKLASLQFEVNDMTPSQFAAYVRSEHDKWAKVIKGSGMKLSAPE